jgi:hypothetical protein
MQTVDGFTHRPGNHCGSTSLRNLADHYGWGFDEPQAFGLAAGLGFTYFELPESPWRAFFGRPLWLEVAFFEYLDIGHDHREGGDWATTWDRLTAAVDRDDPVMVFSDIYYLDYYGTDTHFSPHSLLVVGYEEGEEDRVLLGDSEFDEPQELPAERLRAAMNTDHVSPLTNRHLVVTDPELGREPAAAARNAIAEVATYMQDPETASRPTGPGTHGVPGIERFAADLPEFVDLPDPSWATRFAYQNVERRGTGGGAFRRMYADFLADAPCAVPADLAAEMAGIADDWTALSETLREASEAGEAEMAPLLEEASDGVAAVAERERACFERLVAAID